jgi:hypothetical protein
MTRGGCSCKQVEVQAWWAKVAHHRTGRAHFFLEKEVD